MRIKETEEVIEYLRDFSADVIASLTLARNYDLKRVAHDIEHLIEKYEAIVPTKKNCKNNKHRYNYDLFDSEKEHYCIDCGAGRR